MRIRLDHGARITLEDDRPVLHEAIVRGQPTAYGDFPLVRVDAGWSVIGLETVYQTKWAAFVVAACQSFPVYLTEIEKRVKDHTT